MAEHAFIAEVMVTGRSMNVEYNMEYVSEDRPSTRTLVWEREWIFDHEYPLNSDELQAVAEANLASIGYRTVDGEWWPWSEKTPPHAHTQWYAVLERIPGSLASWREGFEE